MASIANPIKLEQEEGLSPANCFICLEQVTSSTDEKFTSLNVLFKYLNIMDKINPVICDKCKPYLTKFKGLFINLEKIKLEMEYLLDYIQFIISNSKKDWKPVIEFASVRESVMQKCKEKMCKPKLKILLEKVNLLTPVKSEILAPAWSPNSDTNDFDNDLTSSDSSNYESSTASDGEVNVKPKISLKVSPTNSDGVGFSLKATKRKDCRRIKCRKCSKTFYNKAILQRHINDVHLRLKPFKCSTCEKGFTRLAELRDHVKLVHSLNPYKCDLCSKSFANFRCLKRHKDIHTKPKPQIPIDKMVSCKKCGKAFDNFRSLRRHIPNVHSENKFPCDICKKMFKSSTNLNRHNAMVHEKRRYPCQVQGCDISYSTKPYLSNHYRKDHPNFKVPVVDKKL